MIQELYHALAHAGGPFQYLGPNVGKAVLGAECRQGKHWWPSIIGL
jgi:hypothetical protein